ncbi:GMC oxidoreductase [Streptomyces sp. NPDC058000]|uniref:GMC oxidoreductase n=1 Tax=Streptomyces sp. NPDC058000 TaxID=3346299 RepID=UPI0036E41A25
MVDAAPRLSDATGLRVVDASVFPTVTRGNTNAPTTTAAEKAADLTKASNGGQSAGAGCCSRTSTTRSPNRP